jgi:hypothetical protein
MNWKLHKSINNDKTKWYELRQNQDDVAYMVNVNCFICGKRIVGEMEPYGNYFVHPKCNKERSA